MRDGVDGKNGSLRPVIEAMSLFGTKRTCRLCSAMSALRGKAENMCSHCGARLALGTSVGAIEAISDLEE